MDCHPKYVKRKVSERDEESPLVSKTIFQIWKGCDRAS